MIVNNVIYDMVTTYRSVVWAWQCSRCR